MAKSQKNKETIDNQKLPNGNSTTYNEELGPVIEVPIKLRIPKHLYEIWTEIVKNPGWNDDEHQSQGNFQFQVNYEVLRLYTDFLNQSEVVPREAIGERTLNRLLKKHHIDMDFLERLDHDRDLIDAIIAAESTQEVHQQ